MTTTCSITNCTSAARARGWCSKHYQRWVRLGDPKAQINCRGLAIEDRLTKIGWVVTQTGCWDWSGGRDSWGYGTITINYRQLSVHRVAYQAWKGPLTEGKIIRHTCDNPSCINPEHLLEGTYKENSADRDSRGRSGSAKLCAEEVLEIRAAWSVGEESLRQLGERYGVTKECIASIVHRRTWRDL